MTYDLWVLFGVVAALAINPVVMALPLARRSVPFFWTIVAFNAIIGTLVIGFGMPGFDHLPSPAGTLVSVMLGGLFFFHVAQYFDRRTRWQREAIEEAREARRAERAARDEE